MDDGRGLALKLVRLFPAAAAFVRTDMDNSPWRAWLLLQGMGWYKLRQQIRPSSSSLPDSLSFALQGTCFVDSSGAVLHSQPTQNELIAIAFVLE
jgi:hypothetical protein